MSGFQTRAALRAEVAQSHEKERKMRKFICEEAMPRYVELYEQVWGNPAEESVLVEQAKELLRENNG